MPNTPLIVAVSFVKICLWHYCGWWWGMTEGINVCQIFKKKWQPTFGKRKVEMYFAFWMRYIAVGILLLRYACMQNEYMVLWYLCICMYTLSLNMCRYVVKVVQCGWFPAIQVMLGISQMNADSQWNPDYNVFHRFFCCRNETIRR